MKRNENPTADADFFSSIFDSLMQQQQELNNEQLVNKMFCMR